MTTTVTKSIGSAGGRDYATIGAFMADVPFDLVAADQAWVGECYNDSEFSGLGAFDIQNIYTTDATRYIRITAASGQSFQDNASVRTNPLIYDQSKGAAITLGASDTFAIDNSNVLIDRLQFKRTAANGTYAVINVNVGAAGISNIVIKNCILQKNDAGAGPTFQLYGANSAINCAIIDNGAGSGVGVQFGVSSSTLLNCTVVQTTANAAHAVGINTIYGTTAVVRNCANFGFATTWSGTPGGATTDYNCSDGTCPSGSNNQNSKTYSNQFDSTNGTGKAWQLKTGSDCIGTGNTDAALAPNDISNFARGSGTAGDSSAWEYSAASSGTLASINGLAVADIASVNGVDAADLASFNGLTF